MELTTNDSNPPNRLAGDEGFKDKTLLVTGGSGFMGKVFIEKVLRTCPLVAKIYMIVRTKKGLNPQARMKQIFKDPFFNLLKEKMEEEILNKVVVIPGDLSEPGLGLSEENRHLLSQEVEVIFHTAASVRFDEPFRNAVLLNTRGTKLMLDLAKECSKLLVFVHVSTAYSHPEETILCEKTYPPPTDPHKIIKIVELLDEDSANLVGERLKGDSPNTYTFTKALAEGLVNDEMDNLPVIILRPSVVIPVWKDPLPGWTDNLNGPTGILVAAGKGVLRTMYCKPDSYADFIPVDCATSIFMIAAYDYINNQKRRVYNLTTSSERRITWKEVSEIGKRIATDYLPLNWVLWYPNIILQPSRLLQNVSVIFMHYLPAVILDSLLILTLNKPVLWKIQKRIAEGLTLFEYYTSNQWIFKNDALVECRKMLNKTESEIYQFDLRDMDLTEYFLTGSHTCRLYLLKESDESLPTARRHLKIMWAIDRFCKLLFWIGVAYLLVNCLLQPLLNVITQNS